MVRGKKIALIVVALAVAITAIAYASKYGFESAIIRNDGAGATYQPGVYYYTETDYLRMDHAELTVAHRLLKSDLTKAVRLLLADAIEQHEPERFKVESLDHFAGDYSIVYGHYSYTYKVLVDGEWQQVGSEIYTRLVESHRKQQRDRIAQMRSLLDSLTKTVEE